ncbi:MAG: phospholipase D-like domain-containing protein, partial [Candidatus Heimdallarchaeota archaeon]
MKQINRRMFFALVVMLVIPTFLMTTTSRTTVAKNVSRDVEEERWFNPSAIVTTTFDGIRNVTCFVGPDSAYDLIISELNKAQTSFYLEVYTLSSEPLVNSLIAAHTRGVEVIVVVSHDRVNSYEDDYTETAAYMLNDFGIDVAFASSSFAFTHAKFWIVDSVRTFVYSGNWAPSSIPQVNYARTNREMGFMFDDTEIAAYYESVFADDLLAGTLTSGVDNGALQANETSGTYTHPFDTTYTVSADMEITPVFAPDNSYELLSALIKSANNTIDVELQYIKFDCYLYDDLLDAAERGVQVRVLIPEPGVANENVTQPLMSTGAQVRFFKGLGHNHNKYINVDGKIVAVSSINWSNNSVVNNREAGAIVRNDDVATYFTTVFDYDWGNSEIPVGFVEPISIVAPDYGEAVSGSYEFKVNFDINTYTTGNIKIGSTTLHTWVDPDGLETATVDLSGYEPGIYTVVATGTPTVGDDIVVTHDFNVLYPGGDWLLLISEVRYDAVAEPNGEF